MNKEEKINTLKNMLNCYLHSTNLTNKEMKESEKFTDELIEDICNTRCCEELPKTNCTLNRQTCGKGSTCKYPHCHL